MRKSVIAAAVLSSVFVAGQSFAVQPTDTTPLELKESTEHVSDKSHDRAALKAAFIQRQMENNASIGRAIKSIASHYPQQITTIVDVALDTYPDKYKEIIYAAISTQPTATEEIVKIAIEKGVSECPNIVELAILAEPSYVNFVVTAAANTTPEELQDIVRVAVVTEPDSADRIVQTLAKEHPDDMVSILTTAIGAVPFVGEYIVDGLLALFPEQADTVVENAVRESSQQRDQIIKIIETAENHGVDAEQLKYSALKGGATEEEIALATKSDDQ
ncbi:hypothetical protein [Alteromonas facilis]|uniref:hypothetical protein n=1 Tax=Alteromonas facilis TaxID=2048004 RepID=UPI000C284996|nr:hypothetical protein [Alteromonas facilis]